jgi:hypothetical protein
MIATLWTGPVPSGGGNLIWFRFRPILSRAKGCLHSAALKISGGQATKSVQVSAYPTHLNTSRRGTSCRATSLSRRVHRPPRLQHLSLLKLEGVHKARPPQSPARARSATSSDRRSRIWAGTMRIWSLSPEWMKMRQTQMQARRRHRVRD